MIEYFKVEEYEFFNPSIIEIDYLVGLAYENCQNKYFHRFVSKCGCDTKLINVTNI